MSYRLHLGHAFDYMGARHAAYQLVSETDGKAYGICDIEGGECVRFGASPSAQEHAEAFFVQVCEAEGVTNRAKLLKEWRAMRERMNLPERGGFVFAPLFAARV